jgi:hypothetical protein
MRYGVLSDNRLLVAQPAPQALAFFEWWYIVFFVSFGAVYLTVTRRVVTQRWRLIAPPRGVGILVALLFIGVQVVLALFSILYPFEIQTYTDVYLAVRSLPTFARQLVAQSSLMLPTLMIMMLVVLFARYRERRAWIFIILLAFAVTQIRAMHGRALLFLMLYVAVCLYHHLVRRIGVAVAAAAVVISLAGIAYMGVLRSGDRVANVNTTAFSSSEFEVILANAYDLRDQLDASGSLRHNPVVYFSDFIAAVPQQILPIAKTTKADWLLSTYYPAVSAMGNGYAFGVLAEAVTGWGVIEIVLRGIFLGLVFGAAHKYVSTRALSMWKVVAYLWLTIWCYQFIRNTTFAPFQWSIYQLFAPIIAVHLTYYSISRGRSRLARMRGSIGGQS